jgi:hypothetical protein
MKGAHLRKALFATTTYPNSVYARLMAKEEYRTLRGFLTGQERDEPPYFAYSASLRIFGDIPNLDAISKALALQPTHLHRKGEGAAGYRHDMWSYEAPVVKSEPLHRHIDVLWSRLKPHKRYLLKLKKTATVDVFLGYRSNSDTAGLEIPYTSLEIFTQLQVPLGVSIIVT